VGPDWEDNIALVLARLWDWVHGVAYSGVARPLGVDTKG